MALTNSEITILKEVAAEKEKEKAIAEINTSAYAEIKTLQDQIQELENKRVTDIKAL